MIIESSSVVIVYIICEELLLSGVVKGNIFCTGRVEMNPDEKIKSEFTAQLKILKRKIDEDPKVSKTVVESIKKHQ